MYPTGNAGKQQPFTQPMHTHPGRKFERKQHGYWERKHGLIERLLCAKCEQRFCALEDYAKKFFYGKSNPIRLQLPPPSGDFSFYPTDYKKLKLFQLSLLWRASEAKGEFFSEVKISDQHREKLRTMLLAGEPGHDFQYPCSMGRLVVNDSSVNELFVEYRIAIETGFFAPIVHDHESWTSFMFTMGGLTWHFCICDHGVPEILHNSYLKEDGRLCLSTQDGSAFIYNFAQKAINSGNVTKADVDEEIRAKRGFR
jgi:hypothetical protein